MKTAKEMLEQAVFNAAYWKYAVEHAASIKKRLLQLFIRYSPFEKLTGTQATIKQIKVFSCSAFVHLDKPKTKVHDTSQPGIMLKCDDNSVYTITVLTNRKTVKAVHATFN